MALTTFDSAPLYLEIHTGDPDSRFVLPATEACRARDRAGRLVTLCRAKVSFDLCIARSCSLRVMSVVFPTKENVFSIPEGGVGALGTYDKGRFGPVADTLSGIGAILGEYGDIFSPDDKRPFFFRSVNKQTKGRVLLDQVQYLTVSNRF